MKLFKKRKSQFYWCDFTVRGQRYRGSTEEKNAAKAGKIAGLKLAEALESGDPLDRKVAVLRDFSKKFLDGWTRQNWSKRTKAYYKDGWRLLSSTTLTRMRLNLITRHSTAHLQTGTSVSD